VHNPVISHKGRVLFSGQIIPKILLLLRISLKKACMHQHGLSISRCHGPL